MGKDGKKLANKLKSALKKWPSFPKLDQQQQQRTGRRRRRRSSSGSSSSSEDEVVSSSSSMENVLLHPVYVGRSRRRYLVSSKVVDHPLFQVLVNRSNDDCVDYVDCEVVLFEHLVWMLENNNSSSSDDDHHSSHLEELAEFYVY